MSELDHNTLRELLEYDPDTGAFTWRNPRAYWHKPGARAGSVNGKGYYIIGIAKRYYSAHRLAWFYVHGVWPTHTIDHINRLRTDNRIANLRDVPVSVNNANVHRPEIVGPKRKRYKAEIGYKGERRNLGSFATKDEARAAYLAARQELYGT